MTASTGRREASPKSTVWLCGDESQSQDSVLRLYSVLAYPGHREKKCRRQFELALNAWKFRQTRNLGHVPHQVPLAVRKMKIQQIEGQLNRGFRRIGWRLSAGSMGYCKVFSGKSVIELSKQLQADKDKRFNLDSPNHTIDGGAVNIRNREWMTSLPVLHLAIAFYSFVGVFMNHYGCSLGEALINLSFRKKWLGPMLEQAESHRIRLPEMVSSFDSSRAIRVRSAEPQT
jgi:hypothetical protein